MSFRAILAFLFFCGATPAVASEPNIITHFTDPALARHLFYGNRASAEARATKVTSSGDTLYDVTYSTDPFGRRNNPYNGKNGEKNQLLFIGCSDTFGEGLNDRDTIPSQVSRFTKSTRTYNYGAQGYGPGHVLSYLRYGGLAKQFADPAKVTLIYLWGDHLYERATGSLFHLSWGANVTPYYFIKGDRLEFGGSLADAYPIRTAIAQFLSRIPFLRSLLYEKALFRDLPESLSDSQVNLNLTILKEAYEEYRRQFKNDRFILALIPNTKFDRVRMREPLEKVGIKIVDMSQLYWNEKDPQQFQFKGDGHATIAGAQKMAKALIQTLHLE